MIYTLFAILIYATLFGVGLYRRNRRNKVVLRPERVHFNSSADRQRFLDAVNNHTEFFDF